MEKLPFLGIWGAKEPCLHPERLYRRCRVINGLAGLAMCLAVLL
jgi:hypothetical protein